jgi:hypothetical protein
MSNDDIADSEAVNKKLVYVREKIVPQLTELHEKEGIGHDIIYNVLYEVIAAIENDGKGKGLNDDYFQNLRRIAHRYYDKGTGKVE